MQRRAALAFGALLFVNSIGLVAWTCIEASRGNYARAVVNVLLVCISALDIRHLWKHELAGHGPNDAWRRS